MAPGTQLEKYQPTRFLADGSHYDKRRADYAVAFIQALKHTKGRWAGKNFDLIDWQEKIIRDLFGTLKADGYRQFTTAYVEIPKKQGKSELAAAIALLLTCADGEERAEVYGCAADRQQASIVFEVAADMIRMSPALSKRVKILSSQKRIVYKPTNSFYQVLSAEAYSKHGFNISGVVFDELHTQPNRALFDVMTKGSGDARTQPLYFLITTAGTDIHSICYEQHQKALDILEGKKVDPTFYPVVYGAGADEDWTSEKVWRKANPSLDITVPIDKVQAACESAKQNPAEENTFRQLRLNQWVKQSVRWMPMRPSTRRGPGSRKIPTRSPAPTTAPGGRSFVVWGVSRSVMRGRYPRRIAQVFPTNYLAIARKIYSAPRADRCRSVASRSPS